MVQHRPGCIRRYRGSGPAWHLRSLVIVSKRARRMSAMLETIDGGVAVTVQDRGRPGYRKIGVPVCGALDPVYLAAANALLGNEPGAAALEVIFSGPSLKVLQGEVRVALIGALGAKVDRERGRRFQVEPQATATLFPGDVI